jgi:hypothetical protein
MGGFREALNPPYGIERHRRGRAASKNHQFGIGSNAMYTTAKGEEIFVIDGHTHFWDGSPANQKNIHGKQFIECFYAYHSNLSPPSERWQKEKFEKYDAATMFDDLFVHGYDDMAILQPTYLTDFYKWIQHDRA